MGNFNSEILGRLAELSEADLNAALAAIRADLDTYREGTATAETVAALQSLREASIAVRGELTNRANLASEHATALADLDAAFAADGTPGDTMPDGDGEPDALTEQAPNQPGIEAQERVNETHTDAPGDGTERQEGEGDNTVTASARRRLGDINTNQGTGAAAAVPRPRLPQLRTSVTAAAGLPSYSPGQSMTRENVGAAFAEQAQIQAPGRDHFQKVPIVTMRSEFPEGRTLRRGNDPYANMRLVEEVLADVTSRHARDVVDERVAIRTLADGGRQSLVAAGGICGPLETLYDIQVIGDVDRPVRDALVRFGAERGGIQYRPAMDGVTQTGGIGAWTTTQDTASPLVPKTCVEISCPGVTSATVEAIYECLTFSNMTTRFDPELFDAVVRAQDIAHARFAENRLIGQLIAGSKAMVATQLLGATRDILANLDKVTAYYRNVHRLNRDVPLRWIVPAWVQNLIRADMTRQMVGDGMQALAVTDQMISQWLAERNINVTYHMDGIDPADLTVPTPDVVVPAQFYTLTVAEATVPGFPDAISSLLFAEGDWLYLDGGTLDLGVVRDSTLNGQNRFQTFSEEFGFPAFRGIESLHLVMPVQPTGQSAATKDTSAAAD
jgi:hypothetical protein